jgi:hypothetical protein
MNREMHSIEMRFELGQFEGIELEIDIVSPEFSLSGKGRGKK